MSEPITLTKRERAVFSHMARTLGNGKAGDDIIVSNALLHFLDADFRVRSAESASHPRVPGASAKLEADFREFIKKAEPGNLAELIETVAYERGRRAGIEAAAQECRHYYADPMRNRWYFVQNATAIDIQKTIRALADKPAPDALLAGIEHVREHLRTDGNAVRLIAWLDAEIAARKGG